MIILITGTRKGIGRELAEAYLAEGHTVIGCSRSESDLTNPQYHHFICDVGNEDQVLMLRQNISTLGLKVDALVNNAGVASMNHVLTTPVDKVHDIFNTNFIGTFLLTREFAKTMLKPNRSRIINFSTCAAALSLEGEAIYAASKSAVESFTKTSAKELAPYNITVNTIGATPYDTDLIRGVPKEKMVKLLNQQPLSRLASFDDIKNVIDFFFSDRSDFITGQTLYLGGIN